MKRKIVLSCVGSSMAVLLLMWMNSPLREMNRSPEIDVEILETTSIISSVYFQGTVAYENSYDLYVDRAISVTKLHVKEGDIVEPGDILYEYTTNYENAHVTSADVLEVFAPIFSETTAQRIYLTTQPSEGQIYAPVGGMIITLGMTEGELVNSNTACVSIADPERMCIRAKIPEDYIQDLELGMRCEITGNAFRENVYTGTLNYIQPYATTSVSLTGTGETVVEALLSIDDADEALRSGYSARVEIFTTRRDGIVTAPYTAIRQDEKNQEYVYVFENGTAKRRNVITGTELRDAVEICTGLQPGESLILQPDLVMDGLPVRLRDMDEN